VVDLTIPGWVASEANITCLLQKTAQYWSHFDNLFVFDLYGNSTFCFEQFDGTQALPFKEGGKYHLAGNVVVCNQQIFRKIIGNTIPLYSGAGDAKCVIIPPLPRYLFTGCCNKPGHCSNITSPSHASRLLSDTIGLRSVLKKALAAANLSNVRILDTCCESGCAPTDNINVRLEKIREVISSDGVHFSQLSYKNITSACIGGAAILHTRKDDNPSGHTVRGRVFYWRGFRSPVGAVTCLDMRARGQTGVLQRGLGHGHRKYHPYRN
jgi:hypothetical protein